MPTIAQPPEDNNLRAPCSGIHYQSVSSRPELRPGSGRPCLDLHTFRTEARLRLAHGFAYMMCTSIYTSIYSTSSNIQQHPTKIQRTTTITTVKRLNWICVRMIVHSYRFKKHRRQQGYHQYCLLLSWWISTPVTWCLGWWSNWQSFLAGLRCFSCTKLTTVRTRQGMT